MREAAIESKCVRYAAAQGWMPVKVVPYNLRGFPDRIFFGPGKRTMVVEFKKPGEQPTRLQEERHRVLRAMGHEVHVIDNYDDFVGLFNTHS